MIKLKPPDLGGFAVSIPSRALGHFPLQPFFFYFCIYFVTL